ncbi:MAG TPA: cytochrome c [Bacteroidota bacterium]|nr:cytochrome c [Bacteroidota bacterium]
MPATEILKSPATPVGILILLLVAGCNDMYDNQKIKPLEESKFYGDHLSARPLPEGTVARGENRPDELFSTGKVDGKYADVFPFAVTEQHLVRGRDRFNTFCSPCHGKLGDGGGMIVQRGFPRPNSFHSDSVRAKPSGFYFDVITNGFGRMYSYAASLPANDCWAVVAYIRALQLSQHAPYEELQAADKRKISEPHK